MFEFYDKIAELNNLHSQVYICLSLEQKPFAEYFQENDIKFYFDLYCNINNFIQLENAFKAGVSDVFILDDLCYRLPRVKELCNNNGVRLRLNVNQIPSLSSNQFYSIKTPVYMPENWNELNKYYDTIEFDSLNSWNRLRHLYDIWFKEHTWDDTVKILYPEWPQEIDFQNNDLFTMLCEYKMKCGYRCFEKGKCNKCDQV